MFEKNEFLLVDQQAANQYCSTEYYYYTNDMCDGSFCQRDYNCLSGCCYLSYCEHDCSYALEWLWWTLSFLFLFCCIAAMIGGARRRRMAAMRAAQHRNHSECDSNVIVVQTHRADPCQPAQGQPMPPYNAQQPYMQVPQQQPDMYGNYQQQQPMMYGQAYP